MAVMAFLPFMPLKWQAGLREQCAELTQMAGSTLGG